MTRANSVLRGLGTSCTALNTTLRCAEAALAAAGVSLWDATTANGEGSWEATEDAPVLKRQPSIGKIAVRLSSPSKSKTSRGYVSINGMLVSPRIEVKTHLSNISITSIISIISIIWAGGAIAPPRIPPFVSAFGLARLLPELIQELPIRIRLLFFVGIKLM